jgi:hypothetical protein
MYKGCKLQVYKFAGFLICALAFLSGCTGSPVATPVPTSPPLDLLSLLPQDGEISGWGALTEPSTFQPSNLFNLVDGQADAFFAYGFEQVSTRRYQNADGVFLNVEIWQLATSADAYGLFHSGRAGQPAKIGVEGDSDPGRRLAFWQDRYFASINVSAAIADEILWELADKIAVRLPPGGSPPAILAFLPGENLIEGSALFFHEEISIQNDLWLGGENLLGLSQQTNGALARYNLGGETVHLLLIEYPASEQAANALKALQASAVDDFLAVQTKDTQLAAVFGNVDTTLAQAFVAEALK